MITRELLRQVKLLQIKAGHLVTADISGAYLSALKGRGMEFDEVREYHVGDDVRRIDWNVTARAGSPYVKVFREERELTLMLLVDVSRSLEFGTGDRLKKEVCAEISALLALLATRNNDKVGVILFSDHVEHYIPPRKGRGHIWNIIQSVLAHQTSGRGTSLGTAFSFLQKTATRRTQCFVLSDFLDHEYEQSLGQLRSRHSVTLIKIRDARETQLPRMGVVALEDLETGAAVVWNTDAPDWQSAWRGDNEVREARFHKNMRRWGLDYIEIDTGRSAIQPLLRHFQRKKS